MTTMSATTFFEFFRSKLLFYPNAERKWKLFGECLDFCQSVTTYILRIIENLHLIGRKRDSWYKKVVKDARGDKGRAEDKGRKVEMTGSRNDEPLTITACTLVPRLWHDLLNLRLRQAGRHKGITCWSHVYCSQQSAVLVRRLWF